MVKMFGSKAEVLVFFLLFLCHKITSVHSANDDRSGDDSDGKRSQKQKPHIIVIVADDMGFNDASVHGSNQIPTPNIDALGLLGIQLNRMYVAPMCTPSRSAFMTGKYESNIGMQHFVIPSDSPYGLSPDEKILPQYMQESGYKTYMVGKWHLGFFKKKYTPLFRGFDSFTGYLGPYIDYYNHSLKRIGLPYDLEIGFDMRKNLSVYWEANGTYATDLFTKEAVKMIANHNANEPMFLYLPHLSPHTANEFDPLQAPQEEINKFRYIQNNDRRTYAAMVSKLDQSIGKVIKALDDNEMLQNSIILFFSDNGAPVVGQHANSGSNHPFRGQKDSPWEGAIRSLGAIWSPLLQKRQRVSNQLIHITDWLPTFAKIAGIQVQGKIDGKNVWTALSRDLPSPRRDLLCHYDQVVPYRSYISGDFKYVHGSTYDGLYDYWLSSNNKTEENIELKTNYGQEILTSDAGRSLLKYSSNNLNEDDDESSITPEEIEELRRQATIDCRGLKPAPRNSSAFCDPTKAPCLFNITDDPCETTNLAAQLPIVLLRMQREVEYYGRIAKPPRNKPSDPNCNPARFNGTWTWWFDEPEVSRADI